MRHRAACGYMCYGFWNKKPATLQALLPLSFPFAERSMLMHMASYLPFVLAFGIYIMASPIVYLPSSLVLNFADGNNTNPPLSRNKTDLINDTPAMNTAWANSQPSIWRTTNPSAASPHTHLLGSSTTQSRTQTSFSFSATIAHQQNQILIRQMSI